MFCIVVQIFVRTHHAMANNTPSAVAIDTPNVATIASLVVIALESAKADASFSPPLLSNRSRTSSRYRHSPTPRSFRASRKSHSRPHFESISDTRRRWTTFHRTRLSLSYDAPLSACESERENAFAADDTHAVFKSPSKLRAPLHPVLSCSLPFSFCSLRIKITSSAVSFCT